MALTKLQSPEDAARWLRERVTGTLRQDSRHLQPGDGFIAWPGAATDGRRFVPQALAAGAAACLVEHHKVDRYGFDDPRIATLAGMKAATGPVADLFFGQPGARLQKVATTGTNGKTSTAWWTAQALTLLGRRCGVVGTLGIGVPPADVKSTGLTTPDPVTLHAAFRRFADEGFAACALEASSIGLDEQRLEGVAFDVALFTNFTRDHLDYHGSMEAYWAAKRRLFSWPGLRSAVVNVDDRAGERLAAELAERPGSPDLWTVSAARRARLVAEGLHYEGGGLAFTLREGSATVSVKSSLVGEFNASNLLVVLGGLRALGVPLIHAAAVVPRLQPVPGRLQRVGDAALEVVVDYAHTPDALEKLLIEGRRLLPPGGRLHVLFGCGGDRDRTKRPLMAAAVAKGADVIWHTSDNPRNEDPEAILDDAAPGIPEEIRRDGHRYHRNADRAATVRAALSDCRPGDLLLLAGKGHEPYQEVQGVKHPYSDRTAVEAFFKERP